MHRTHSHIHFNPRGEPTGIAIELYSYRTGERLACVISAPGPFDDFTEVYQETYERAVASITNEVEGQAALFRQDHPRMLLRRSTDLVESPPM